MCCNYNCDSFLLYLKALYFSGCLHFHALQVPESVCDCQCTCILQLTLLINNSCGGVAISILWHSIPGPALPSPLYKLCIVVSWCQELMSSKTTNECVHVTLVPSITVLVTCNVCHAVWNLRHQLQSEPTVCEGRPLRAVRGPNIFKCSMQTACTSLVHTSLSHVTLQCTGVTLSLRIYPFLTRECVHVGVVMLDIHHHSSHSLSTSHLLFI